MTAQDLITDLYMSEQFFERSTRCLTEEQSNYRPVEGIWTAAQQMAHVAQTIDWFIEGASRPEGFDLDFEKHAVAIQGVTSLAESRKWVAKAYENARKFFEGKSDADLLRPLPEGPVMGGVPILGIVGAITDHSAHHRGALTIYSRLLGKTPIMPYAE
jgi:uncharacterized damage-inducible protein DinB